MIRLSGASTLFWKSPEWTSPVVLGWTPQTHTVTHNLGKRPNLCLLFYGSDYTYPDTQITDVDWQSNTNTGYSTTTLDLNRVEYNVYRVNAVPQKVYAGLVFLN